ncbi:TlpA family protein disulfide reductase [Sphingobacterium bovisgrunnientis]|uniref:TlpA family protein disulfide reductase n=1 Tax=Sphingobacterium bovisgrunnientis TaxID=1874697 RepID=UPI00135A0F99|nr:thioredoxin-like domain-containing protein [Sphingobacterium bovisgrunnientis]
MRTLLSLLLFLTISTLAFSQTEKTNKLRINFSGKTYAKLDLRIALDDKSKHVFNGKIGADSIWEFAYPDSLYDYIKYFDIDNEVSSDSIFNSISFASVDSGDTLWCGSFHVSRGDVNLNLKFYQLNIFDSIPIRKDDLEIIYKKNLQDRYLIDGNEDKELLISIRARSYSYFNSSLSKLGPKYFEELDTYIKLTRKYPDSQKLISRLESTIPYYASKEDLAKVYEEFSDSAKESYFGMKIKRYLKMDIFDNMDLYSLGNKKMEPIVRYPDKFSLIVFSASWCKWCHEMIPIVEEVHRVAGDKLDIVYISIDEESTIKKWNELVKNGKIPFRNLLALNLLKEVKKKYLVQGIPYTLLVHPNNKLEVLNLWEKVNRKKLYQILNFDMTK